jgi:hypothetical protein
MRFKTACRLAKGLRYIQRMNGNTLFDVIKYNPENIDQEDIYADDWVIPEQKKITYFNKAGRTSVHAKNIAFLASKAS